MNYLTPYGFDATIARTTYLYLQERQDAAFPIGVGDLLDEDMGMSRTQVQEALADLMRINGRSFQGAPVGAPLLTVEDLIRYLQASPREEALAA